MTRKYLPLLPSFALFRLLIDRELHLYKLKGYINLKSAENLQDRIFFMILL